MRACLCCVVLGFLACVGFSAQSVEPVIAQWHLEPFWDQGVMQGESLFFLEPPSGGLATAPLLFTPTAIHALVHPPTGAIFEEGRDYTVDTKSKLLTLTPDSRIPHTTRAEFEPPLGKTGQRYKDGSRDILFENTVRFHMLQVEVSYNHNPTEWTSMKGPNPRPSPKLLPAVMKKLGNKEPLTICLLGDSISAGLNASSTSDPPPRMPPYGTLVARALEERFGSVVDYTNFSISGKATPWGIEQVAAVAEKKPDLVLIAFGMNDASGKMSPETYRNNTEAIMAGIRAIHLATEFVLVTTMRGNDDWIHTATERYPQYRDALVTLQQPGVAVADLTAFWTTLLAHKKFADITGNGVNHPNDFGHRIYAQVILSLFGKGPTG
ncbi:MAG: SGNH/GDSL hydrolase family protein [Candidatus Hydrogenedentes bacterium]|nr:SGNH/GDSL hydrolase family protein [Candidatus Hydrogenedentota bacterium]